MAFSFAAWPHAVLSAAIAAMAAPAAHAAETRIEVTVDRASVIRAPAGMSTIVVGNPLIADVSTQRNGVIVVTGKSFGTTNIMMLDGAGQVLSENLVTVRRGDDGVVMVQRGGKRESMTCNPRCEPALAIGDNPDSFGATAGQISQRATMSSGQ